MNTGNKVNKKILVIDDNKALCELICDTFDAYDIDADYVTDTKTLTDEILTSSDVIFLDLCIPDIDGFELIQLLANKKIRSELILMSGKAISILNGAKIFAQQHGLNVIGSLSKPFHTEEILNLVNLNDKYAVKA